ncbi:transporter substrate-binding domain-containing protein [Paracoccus pacificus]|uniref:Transporter substrate-binding domain-containing protein n=1 Tax=Paracoccus pacificus TaxID=1463598 RepID=A0ABW4R9H5_9RHOB
MKKLLLAAAIMALTVGAGAAQTVRLATEGGYPPYNFINDKGEIDGFERELGDELCKRMQADCTWVKNDWDSIIPNLVSSNYDAILAGMSINDERKKVIQFSDNYLPPVPSAYVGLTADADVKGGVVAAQTSTIQAARVAESGATLLEFATPDETVAAVRNGQAVAVLADKDFLNQIVADSNGELVFVGDEFALGEGIAVGLRQSDNDLKAKFDGAIQEMKKDGSLNTMIKKWFGEDARVF